MFWAPLWRKDYDILTNSNLTVSTKLAEERREVIQQFKDGQEGAEA